MMFVFVTPNSLRSNWLHFESGYAYSKGIRVTPVGFGVDLSMVGAPLNLLQGFNITCERGLNNLIAVTNDVFAHSHLETFSAEDLNIVGSGNAAMNATLGPHSAVIEEIVVTMKLDNPGGSTPCDAPKLIASTLTDAKVEHVLRDNSILAQGMTLRINEIHHHVLLEIQLDPAIADIALPLIDRLATAVNRQGMKGGSVKFHFAKGIDARTSKHTLTGKLHGTGIRFSDDGDYAFKNLTFKVDHQMLVDGQKMRRGSAFLHEEVSKPVKW